MTSISNSDFQVSFPNLRAQAQISGKLPSSSSLGDALSFEFTLIGSSESRTLALDSKPKGLPPQQNENIRALAGKVKNYLTTNKIPFSDIEPITVQCHQNGKLTISSQSLKPIIASFTGDAQKLVDSLFEYCFSKNSTNETNPIKEAFIGLEKFITDLNKGRETRDIKRACEGIRDLVDAVIAQKDEVLQKLTTTVGNLQTSVRELQEQSFNIPVAGHPQSDTQPTDKDFKIDELTTENGELKKAFKALQAKVDEGSSQKPKTASKGVDQGIQTDIQVHRDGLATSSVTAKRAMDTQLHEKDEEIARQVSEIAKLKRQLETKENRQASLTEKNGALTVTVADLESRNAALTKANKSQQKALEKAQNDLREAQTDVVERESAILELEKQVANRQDRVVTNQASLPPELIEVLKENMFLQLNKIKEFIETNPSQDLNNFIEKHAVVLSAASSRSFSIEAAGQVASIYKELINN